MQIGIEKNISEDTNVLYTVINKAEEYLAATGVQHKYYTKQKMDSFSQYDLLLTSYDASIRPLCIENKGNHIWEEDVESYIYEIHQKKYGCIPQYVGESSIASTTAIIINEVLKGNISNDSYVLYKPDRKIKNKRLTELEIVLFDRNYLEVIDFYSNFLGFVTEKQFRLSIVGTYFSWADLALKFRFEDRNVRMGAIGYINQEILNINTNMKNRKICIIGVPVNGLCSLVNEPNNYYNIFKRYQSKGSIIRSHYQVYDYLCIKYDVDKITQYRNQKCFFQYSDTSLKRLEESFASNGKKINYSHRILELLHDQYAHDSANGVKIVTNCTSLLKYDIRALKKIGVDVRIEDPSILIHSNNKYRECAMALVVLCDIIDIGDIREIFWDRVDLEIVEKLINSEICLKKEICNWFDVDIKRLQMIGNKCGFSIWEKSDNQILISPAPYRGDIVDVFDFLRDINNFRFSFGNQYMDVLYNTKSMYQILDAFQKILHFRDFAYADIGEILQVFDAQVIEQQLCQWVVKHRNKKFPMRYYYLYENELEGHCNVLIWCSGNIKLINELGNDIKQVCVHAFGDDILWNIEGNSVTAYKETLYTIEIKLIDDSDILHQFGVDQAIIARIVIRGDN